MTTPPLPPISAAEPLLPVYEHECRGWELAVEGCIQRGQCPDMALFLRRLLAAHRQLATVAEAAQRWDQASEAASDAHDALRTALAGTAGRRVVAYVDEEGDTQRDRGDG